MKARPSESCEIVKQLSIQKMILGSGSHSSVFILMRFMFFPCWKEGSELQGRPLGYAGMMQPRAKESADSNDELPYF